MATDNKKSSISDSHNYVIIVAGGSGTRMRSAVPKQFLLLSGKPVMMHTMEAFYHSTSKPAIIIVLHADYHTYWRELCVKHNFNLPHELISGGDSRFHSVKNGLNLIPDLPDTIIAIQDAVRPLTSITIIDNAFDVAEKKGNAVTAVKSRDSVRQVSDNNCSNLNRDEIYLVQTPQVFRSDILKKAYLQPYQIKFTDDATVVEELGEKINLVEGSYTNIKITFQEDVAIAELLLNNGS